MRAMSTPASTPLVSPQCGNILEICFCGGCICAPCQLSRQLRQYERVKTADPQSRFRWSREHNGCCDVALYKAVCTCGGGSGYPYEASDVVCGALCWQCIYARAFEEVHRYSDTCCCYGTDWALGWCRNRWCLTPIGWLACLAAFDGFTGPYVAVGENDNPAVNAGMYMS